MTTHWKSLAIMTTFSVVPYSTLVSAQAASELNEGGAMVSGGLEEVIVTAQRRSQSVLEVPVSITAFTGKALEDTGIESLTDLKFTTPGYLTSTGSGYVQVYMRGIGNRVQIGADPSVTTFVDDTPRVYSSLVDDFSTVERVEVLKGAQGGLYGRNATAGVINIVTRKPDTQELAGEAKLSYGTKETANGSLYVNVPISDTMAMNFNVSRREHGDYLENKAIDKPYSKYAELSEEEAAGFGDTGQHEFLSGNPEIVQILDAPSHAGDMADREYTYADGKLRYQGERLQLVLAADWSETEDTMGTTWKSVDFNRTYATYGALMNSFGFGDAQLPIDYLYPSGSNKYGEFEAASSINAHNKIEDYGGSVTIDYEFDAFTLTSISSLRWNNSDFLNDVTGSAVPNAGFSAKFDRENFYQEIRAVSASDGNFRWLGGITYFDEEIDNYVQSILLGNGLRPTTNTTGTEGYSYYLQGEYDLTDKLTGILSGRYIDESKYADFPASVVAVYDPTADTVTNGVPVASASYAFDTTKFLPAATLSYALDSGGTVYARWARGMKTGGANPMVHPAQTLFELNGLEPEEVDTYEIGWRTNLMDGEAQFTSAVFYNDYQDLQVIKSGYTGLAGVYFNAGEAETYGAEAALTWQIAPYLTVSGNVGYLEAEYTDFQSEGIPDLKVAPFDVSGNRMILAPEWQGSLVADFEMPIGSNLDAVATVLYSYISEFYTDDRNIEDTSQDAYSVVNLRFGARTSDGQYGAYVSVKNLFEEEYITWGSAAPSAYSVQTGNPRIVTAELEVKF